MDNDEIPVWVLIDKSLKYKAKDFSDGITTDEEIRAFKKQCRKSKK